MEKSAETPRRMMFRPTISMVSLLFIPPRTKVLDGFDRKYVEAGPMLKDEVSPRWISRNGGSERTPESFGIRAAGGVVKDIFSGEVLAFSLCERFDHI